MSKHRDDLELVAAVAAGDAAAIEAFAARMGCVGRFVARLHFDCGRPLSDEDLADVEQDVLALLWAKLPGYRGDAALETWAFRFCDLCLRNAVRARARRQGAFRPLDPERLAVAQVREGDRVHDLQRALRRLSSADAALLRSRYLQGERLHDIALRLGLPCGTVKTRVHRALRRLRHWLEPVAEASRSA